MRDRGTGTIERTRQGRFRLRLTDGHGRRHSLGVVETREEAEALLAEACDDLAMARQRVATGITLEEYGARWLDRRDEQGLTSERNRWAVHIANHSIASMPVRAIEAQDVRLWLERISQSSPQRGNGHRSRPRRPLARQTVSNVLNVLRTCLAAAVDDRILHANPAASIRVPRRRKDLELATVEPWTWLDVDEQTRLLDACPNPHRWMVQFCIWTGLREGELYHLLAEDVRLDSPQPHIVVRYGSERGPTKTRRIRYVPMLPGAVEAWRQWRKVAHDRILDTGTAFPPLRGSRRATRAPGPPPWWERSLAAAGIRGQTGAPVTFHSLRHTCASMLVSGAWGPAWSLEEVQAMLGHRSITTTQRYAHLAHSALARAAQRTRDALASSSAPVSPIREPAKSPRKIRNR